jgi:hypothetical protein
MTSRYGEIIKQQPSVEDEKAAETAAEVSETAVKINRTGRI